MPRVKEPKEQRLSVPSYGRTIGSAIAEWTQPLIEAYCSLIATIDNGNREKIARAYNNIFSPIMAKEENKPTQEQIAKLAASSVLSMWMISQKANKAAPPKTFRDAEEWFLGKRFSPQLPRLTQVCEKWPSKKTCEILSSLRYDNDFVDLFPYVVETFETLTVLRPRSHVPMKRYSGLYYTPSDICDYIVQQVLAPWKTKNTLNYPSVGLSCIDPACGSGVFLRAVLDWHSSRLLPNDKNEQHSRLDAIQAIYGMDISHQAIQSCAFTLLFDCIDEVRDKGLDPWCVWQAIRGNLAVIDSTQIVGFATTEPAGRISPYKRSELRKELLRSSEFERLDLAYFDAQDSHSCFSTSNVLIGNVFPEMSEGFSAIVGNPPYSKIRREKRQATLTNTKLDSELGKQSLDTAYLPFVKMMWTFANRRYARAGMVLPLSVAYHSGKHFSALRRAIMARGKWYFGFFDRTPDSLFGDDTKTRNCIALAEFSERGKSVATTNLRRWNSQNRKDLFANLTFTELRDISIEHVIPKIGSEQELLVYKLLMSQREKLGSMVKPVHNRSGNLHDSRIFFRSTAYNWLPIFRNLPITSGSVTSTSSRFNCLEFSSPVDADFGFAVTSSRIAYWLWRIEGDGFHLNESFLTRLPFHPSAFSEASIQKLCFLSHALWENLQLHPIEKFNAGVLAVSYRPYDCIKIINEIDKLLIETYNIPNEFFVALQRFVVETIEAGRVNSSQLRPIMEKIKPEGKQ